VNAGRIDSAVGDDQALRHLGEEFFVVLEAVVHHSERDARGLATRRMVSAVTPYCAASTSSASMSCPRRTSVGRLCIRGS
jgi:hypothetical protein